MSSAEEIVMNVITITRYVWYAVYYDKSRHGVGLRMHAGNEMVASMLKPMPRTPPIVTILIGKNRHHDGADAVDGADRQATCLRIEVAHDASSK